MPRIRRPRQRTTLTRSRESLEQKTISQIRKEKETKQQADNKRLSNIKNITNNYFSNLPDLKNIDDKANSYIAKNINNVPANLQTIFKNIVLSEVNKAKSEQNKIISQYNSKAKEYKQTYERFDKKNKRDKEKQYRAKYSATQQVLKRLKDGEKLDLDSVNTFINQKGLQAKYEAQGQAESKILQKVNVYTEEQAKKGNVPGVKEIKDKFGISLKQASQAQSNIKKMIPEPIQTEIQTEKGKTNINQFLDLADKEFNIFLAPEKQSRDLRVVPFKNPRANQQFKQLTPTAKNQVLNYIYVKETKRNIISKNDITNLKQDVEDINTLNSVLRKDPKIKKLISLNVTNIPKDINIKADLKNVEKLYKFSDAELKKRIKSGDANIIKLADSLNNIVQLQNQLNKNKIKGLENKIIKELKDLQSKSKFVEINKLTVELTKKPIKQIVLYSNLINLQNKIRQGEGLTNTDVKDTLTALSKVPIRKELERKYKTQKSKIDNLILPSMIKDIVLYWKTLQFVGRSTVETVKVLMRDIKTMVSLAGKVLKATGRLGKDIYLDVADAIKSKLPKNKDLQIKQFNRIFTRFEKAKTKLIF